MKIFYAFLIIIVSAILFMLPLTQMAYDFRTDVREDTYVYDTAPAVTTANVVLSKPIYDDDTGTLSFLSDLSTDIPAYSAYDTTNRELRISGMTANASRTIEVSYDVDSLGGNVAIATVVDRLAYIWLLCCIAFAPAALFAIFTNKA